MTNQELIDDYLADRMSDAERLAFEKQLAEDSDLKQELSFQKQVISSIQAERKAELKAMLNNVPVSGGGSTFGPMAKIATTVIVAAVVVAGVYFLTDDKKPEPVKNLEEPALIVEEPSEPGEIVPESTEEYTPVEETIAEERSEQPVVTQEPLTAPFEKKQAEPKVQQPAEIKTPSLVDDFQTEEGSSDISQPEVYTETEDFSAEELFKSNIEVITDNSKRRYKFHYRFMNDKLYLYGDFNEGLYEILEFNTAKGNTVYLYYKDNYYLISRNQQEVTALEPIKEVTLVEKLNKLRK